MLWRQKMKAGRAGGSWIGPVRVILVEGSTIWLATGSTLVRAKTNQLRPVTKREELASALEGMAVHKAPVTTETLMRAFQGRYCYDMSGNVPSEEQTQQDLTPTEVQVQPQPERLKVDTWEVGEDEDRKTLVRIHHLPRLALFSPSKVATCPVSLDQLTGKRTTVIRPLHGGEEVVINDNTDKQRTLMDRWVRETRLEMKMGLRPLKVRRNVPKTGQKRPPDKDVQDLQKDQDETNLPKDGAPSADLPQQALPGGPLPLPFWTRTTAWTRWRSRWMGDSAELPQRGSSALRQ